MSKNSAEQQSASADGSGGIEVDKKLVDYKVGEEVNCFVKSVCLTGWLVVFVSLYTRLNADFFSSSICSFNSDYVIQGTRYPQLHLPVLFFMLFPNGLEHYLTRFTCQS